MGKYGPICTTKNPILGSIGGPKYAPNLKKIWTNTHSLLNSSLSHVRRLRTSP
jgi:hypothetical protein